MDGSLQHFAPALDVSSVAGRITAIVARRHERAVQRDEPHTASRFDIGLDTIYFAALLLMIENGTGHARDRTELLSVLDTVDDVVAELRLWLRGHTT